jgi:hypothetical protein|tara:strand:+ start:203 stop:502 length:300 start_codon:yes stop_codon:yes gene_type:complete
MGGANTKLISELAHELDVRELDVFNKEKELELKEADLIAREKEFEESVSKLGLMEELNEANVDILHQALVKEAELAEKEAVLSQKEKGILEAIDVLLEE